MHKHTLTTHAHKKILAFFSLDFELRINFGEEMKERKETKQPVNVC